MFSINSSIELEYVNSEIAMGPFPFLLAIDDKFAAPVTASPIQTGLFIPTSFRPAFTIYSWAEAIPIPEVIEG